MARCGSLVLLLLCVLWGHIENATAWDTDDWDLPPVLVRQAISSEAAVERATSGEKERAFIIARSQAWLGALREAAERLPLRQEFSFGTRDPDFRLALIILLYQLEEPIYHYAGGAKDVEVRLLPLRNVQEALLQALRNPDLLDIYRRLISDTEKALSAVPVDSRVLEGLWLAQASVVLGVGGWLVEAATLPQLEKAARFAPDSDAVYLLLAEAQLQEDLPQSCLVACNTILERSVNYGRAFYVRALAHWRLQQIALAQADLDAALGPSLDPAPYGDDLRRRLRARGAVRMLYGDIDGMCVDFEKACSLGDCAGLLEARQQGHCRKKDMGDGP